MFETRYTSTRQHKTLNRERERERERPVAPGKRAAAHPRLQPSALRDWLVKKVAEREFLTAPSTRRVPVGVKRENSDRVMLYLGKVIGRDSIFVNLDVRDSEIPRRPLQYHRLSAFRDLWR